MFKSRWMLTVFLFGFVLMVPALHATPLLPGTSAAPDTFSIGYTGPGTFPTSGTGAGAVSTGTISFEYLTEVVADPLNVFCAGCLDFILQVENDFGSTANINRIKWGGFTGYQTDVGYDLLSVGDLTECGPADEGYCQADFIPTSVDSSGGVIGFNFSSPVTPDEATVSLVIETNATSFSDPGISISGDDGSQSADLGGPGPTGTPVTVTTPEPTSLFLLGAGMIGLSALLGLKTRRS